MNKKVLSFVPIYSIVILAFVLIAALGNQAVTVLSERLVTQNRHCIILDAGHGGEDGGAVSCTGVYEKKLNLEISLKLQDLFHLLGYNAKMIRSSDCSVHTSGNTIAARKASDLKNRVNFVNQTKNAVLLSIHQNHYPDSIYNGAQMFYANTPSSENLAKKLQESFVQHLNNGSNRAAKKAEGIYIMKHVDKPAVLVECGFLSNPTEEAMLCSDTYQKKIGIVIATTVSQFLTEQQTLAII